METDKKLIGILNLSQTNNYMEETLNQKLPL